MSEQRKDRLDQCRNVSEQRKNYSDRRKEPSEHCKNHSEQCKDHSEWCEKVSETKPARWERAGTLGDAGTVDSGLLRDRGGGPGSAQQLGQRRGQLRHRQRPKRPGH